MIVHHRKEVTTRDGRVIRVGDVEPLPDDVSRDQMRWIIRARAIKKSNDEKRERLREKKGSSKMILVRPSRACYKLHRAQACPKY